MNDNDRNNDIDLFNDWVESNKEMILELYQNSEPEEPENLLENVLDDDRPDAYDKWVSELEFKDVPTEFINEEYESYCEGDDEE